MARRNEIPLKIYAIFNHENVLMIAKRSFREAVEAKLPRERIVLYEKSKQRIFRKKRRRKLEEE